MHGSVKGHVTQNYASLNEAIKARIRQRLAEKGVEPCDYSGFADLVEGYDRKRLRQIMEDVAKVPTEFLVALDRSGFAPVGWLLGLKDDHPTRELEMRLAVVRHATDAELEDVRSMLTAIPQPLGGDAEIVADDVPESDQTGGGIPGAKEAS